MTRVAPQHRVDYRIAVDGDDDDRTSIDRSSGDVKPQVIAESPCNVTSATESARIAHHFDSSKQQYSAAKLGMWLFVATEILLFGGLFCLYSIFRNNHPEVFEYGSRYLSASLGAFNTVVLILSSLTIAMAVGFAQRGRTFGVVAMLLLTLLGGAVFLGVKYVEYDEKFEKNLVWGVAFLHAPAVIYGEEEEPIVAAGPATDAVGDSKIGRELWVGTCIACHGDRGQGMPGQAFDIRGSDFVAGESDKELINFIKQGRMPFDALNRTGIQMPSRGGNPMLKDADLQHIVAYIRTFEAPPATSSGQAASEPGDAGADDQATGETADALPLEDVREFYVPKSVIPPASVGPSGLAAGFIERTAAPRARLAQHDIGKPVDPRSDPETPKNLYLYFSIYYMLTGLHALHVIAGMLVIAWVTILAIGGRFGPRNFTRVELTGLYWHVVDVIWIFLFPLLYLIH